MRRPETNRDIDLHLETTGAHPAFWKFAKGRHSIGINLAATWRRAVTLTDEYRGYSIIQECEESEKTDAFDFYIDRFMEELGENFLIERICIERRRQGLRMKHDRCKPCCIERVVWFMINYINELEKSPGPAKWEAR